MLQVDAWRCGLRVSDSGKIPGGGGVGKVNGVLRTGG